MAQLPIDIVVNDAQSSAQLKKTQESLAEIDKLTDKVNTVTYSLGKSYGQIAQSVELMRSSYVEVTKQVQKELELENNRKVQRFQAIQAQKEEAKERKKAVEIAKAQNIVDAENLTILEQQVKNIKARTATQISQGVPVDLAKSAEAASIRAAQTAEYQKQLKDEKHLADVRIRREREVQKEKERLMREELRRSNAQQKELLRQQKERIKEELAAEKEAARHRAAAAREDLRNNKARQASYNSLITSVKRYLTFVAAGLTLRAAVRTLANFEHTITQVKAITSATEEEFRRLTKTARDMGATTQFTASEAAQGMRFLGLVGLDTAKIIETIPSVLNLAAAASIDLGTAADIVSRVMVVFGLNAKETADATDLLTTVMSRSNTDIIQFGDALKYVGPVSASFGVSLKDTTIAIGALGNAGLQASVAGTGLRRVLQRLAEPNKPLKKLFADLNVDLSEVAPGVNSLTSIFEKLRNSGALSNVSEIIAGFGVRGGPAALALLQNVDAMRRLGVELDNSSGRAARFSAMLQQTLLGRTKQFTSALEELIHQTGDAGLAGALKTAVGGATYFVRVLTNIETPLDQVTFKMQLFAGALASITSFIILNNIKKLVFYMTSLAGIKIAASWITPIGKLIGIISLVAGAAVALRNVFYKADDSARESAAGFFTVADAAKILGNRAEDSLRQVEGFTVTLEDLNNANQKLSDPSSSGLKLLVDLPFKDTNADIGEITNSVIRLNDQIQWTADKIITASKAYEEAREAFLKTPEGDRIARLIGNFRGTLAKELGKTEEAQLEVVEDMLADVALASAQAHKLGFEEFVVSEADIEKLRELLVGEILKKRRAAEKRAVEESAKKRLDAETKVAGEIAQISLSETEYKLYQLDKQLKEFKAAGVETTQLEKFETLARGKIAEEASKKQLELSNKRVEVEKRVANEIAQLVLTETQYKLYQLDKQVQEYKEGGASITQVELYESLARQKIIKEEADKKAEAIKKVVDQTIQLNQTATQNALREATLEYDASIKAGASILQAEELFAARFKALQKERIATLESTTQEAERLRVGETQFAINELNRWLQAQKDLGADRTDLELIYTTKINKIQQEGFEKQLGMSQNLNDQMYLRYQEMLKRTSNAAETISQSLAKTYDALTDLLMGNFDDARQALAEMAAEIARTLFQVNLINPFIRSLQGGLGIVAPSPVITLPGLGGGVPSTGESLNANLQSIPPGRNGSTLGAFSSPPVIGGRGADTPSGINVTINVPVQVQTTDDVDQTSASQLGEGISVIVEQKFTQLIMQHSRPGGLLNPSY